MALRLSPLLTTVIATLTLTFAGCKKEAPPPPPPPPAAAPKAEAPPPAPPSVSIAAITLGKSIGPDKKVSAATDTFAKSDTIYAAVETNGTGTAELKAKWTFHKGDKVADVTESTETIVATGPAVTAFNISKPSGWPPGDYQVAVSVGGNPASTKKFTVK